VDDDVVTALFMGRQDTKNFRYTEAERLSSAIELIFQNCTIT
jgi:hypothetical protein